MSRKPLFSQLFLLGALLTIGLSARADAEVCEKRVFKAFSALDVDGNGSITPREQMVSIGTPYRRIAGKRVAEFPRYSRIDSNEDGIYNPIEFLRMANLVKGSVPAGCNIAALRAYSKLDVGKRGQPINFSEHELMKNTILNSTEAERGHGVSAVARFPELDFNRDGKLDEEDIHSLDEAYEANLLRVVK